MIDDTVLEVEFHSISSTISVTSVCSVALLFSVRV
jgi:hypothetical protein